MTRPEHLVYAMGSFDQVNKRAFIRGYSNAPCQGATQCVPRTIRWASQPWREAVRIRLTPGTSSRSSRTSPMTRSPRAQRRRRPSRCLRARGVSAPPPREPLPTPEAAPWTADSFRSPRPEYRQRWYSSKIPNPHWISYSTILLVNRNRCRHMVRKEPSYRDSNNPHLEIARPH